MPPQIRPMASRRSNFLADPPATIYSQSAADFRPPADYIGPRKSRMQTPPDPSMNPKKNSLPIVSVSKLNIQNVQTIAPPPSKTQLPRVCAPLPIPSNCGVHGTSSFPRHTLRLVDARKSLMRSAPSQHRQKLYKRPRKGPVKHFMHYDFHDPVPSDASILAGIMIVGSDRYKVIEAPKEPGTPPPLSGRRHHQGQTETYVEDIADNDGNFKETEMQCDPIYDEPLEPPPIYEIKEGLTVNGTQLDQWEFADLEHAFDQSVVNLAEAVIMESLKQLQEEYELDALKKQHELHRCLRNREIAMLAKYKIAQAKYEEQKKYLETHKPWDQTLDQIIQMVGFDKIRDIAPTHFLESQMDQATYELVRDSIEPHLQEKAVESLKRIKDGRELLDLIIEDSCLKREAEYAGRMYIGDPNKKGSLATDSPSRMSLEFEGEWDGEYGYDMPYDADLEGYEQSSPPPFTPQSNEAEYYDQRRDSRRSNPLNNEGKHYIGNNERGSIRRSNAPNNGQQQVRKGSRSSRSGDRGSSYDGGDEEET